MSEQTRTDRRTEGTRIWIPWNEQTRDLKRLPQSQAASPKPRKSKNQVNCFKYQGLRKRNDPWKSIKGVEKTLKVIQTSCQGSQDHQGGILAVHLVNWARKEGYKALWIQIQRWFGCWQIEIAHKFRYFDPSELQRYQIIWRLDHEINH